MAKRKHVKRNTYQFQLRVGNEYPIDQHVSEILKYKREHKETATAIRDGVRLLWALEQGDLSVLYEMFPQYKAIVGNGGDGAGQIKEAIELLKVIADDIKTNGTRSMQPVAPMTTGKQIAAPDLAMPNFEDDEPLPMLLVKKSTTDNDAGLMFLKSMGQVQ